MSTGASKQNGFRLDRANGKLMGVCAGLGNSLGIDPVIVRIAFVLGTLCGAGILVPIYLAIGLIAD
ncbi:MAG TPA: PspC domain-containing protein [Sphingomonadaceae bacterium]